MFTHEHLMDRSLAPDGVVEPMRDKLPFVLGLHPGLKRHPFDGIKNYVGSAYRYDTPRLYSPAQITYAESLLPLGAIFSGEPPSPIRIRRGLSLNPVTSTKDI
jgi:hypothetical protein